MRILSHDHGLVVDGLVLHGIFVNRLGAAGVDDVIDLVDDSVDAGHVINNAKASPGVLLVLNVDGLIVACSKMMRLDMELETIGWFLEECLPSELLKTAAAP